jgi:transposase
MMIIGVDYHPSFQTIAFFIEETGECGEEDLNHSDEQAEQFYRDLKQDGIGVRVGMEATGYARWFERLLAELGFELWIGHPTEIKAKRFKKLKYDREDARLILRLMRENNFPRVWEPGPENRDLRQLLWHRHRLVQMRTRILNQLQGLAMNEGYRLKEKLFSEQGRALLESVKLNCFASAEPRSTQQGTEHLFVPLVWVRIGDGFAREVRRVLLALVDHRHVEKIVVPFARKELLAFLVHGRSHDRLRDMRVSVQLLG